MITPLLMLMLACTTNGPECPVCPAPDAAELAVDDWEAEVLAPLLEDLRAGVTLWDEEGFGVCSGNRDCDAFLGTEALDLPEGQYLVHAVLKVPSQGSPWKVRFEVVCNTAIKDRPDSTQTHDREFEVKHTGSLRGYPLRPIWKIRSPHPQGSRDCRYELSSVRSDGKPLETWTGRYSTPAPPEQGATDPG